MSKFFKLFTALVMMTLSVFASAQDNTLSGSVKDASGLGLPGVFVYVQGAKDIASVTDIDGRFELKLGAQTQASTLVFSCMGFTDKVVAINGQTIFNVILEEENTVLDESVVIGYGMARKKDLTGSISSVNGTEISSRQTQQISTALQGSLPGVTVTRTNSAPGSGATIRIRGITSMTDGASDPFVLIDGVAGSLSDVNPNDVENITVLKDAASASIYGSQAAAGVILVTTKRGGSKGTRISYNYNLGFDSASNLPEYADAVEYMTAMNEQRYNDLPAGGWYQEYQKEYVENYWSLNQQNPDLYPNEDWLGLILKDYAMRQSHALSLKSVSDKRATSLSIGFDDVDGLFTKNLEWKRYTVRVNNDFQILKWLKASADISLKMVNKLNPHTSPSGIMRYYPAIYKAVWSNGLYAPGKDGTNRYAALLSGGEVHNDTYQVNSKFQLDITPFKGLTISALFAPNFTYVKDHDYQRQTCYWNYGETSSSTTNYIAESKKTTLTETRSDTFEHTTQIYANYLATFAAKHNFSAMAGYENYSYAYEKIVGQNNSFSHSLIESLGAGNSDDLVVGGAERELARRSYFGRVMYNYDSKYYIQGNIRCDGSSRFAPKYRWGTFLSASAGWVFTKENFMDWSKSWLDHGKLRLSYGELGNERIGSYYPYQVSLSDSHVVGYVGNEIQALTGFSQGAATVSDLTWETTSMADVGIDFSMLGHRLSLSGDYYYKKTTGMLIQVPIAPILGLSDPYDNIGDMNTLGWEITAGWRDQVGDFSYSVDFNISDDKSVMGYIGNKEVISGGKIIKEGVEYQSWYGYLSDGLFQTQAEVNEAATIGAQYPGDIRYKNITDSNPDNPVISASEDRVVLGSSLPHYNYGGNIKLGWKNLDFNLTFQGVGQRNSYLSSDVVSDGGSQWHNYPKLILYGNSWSYKNTIEQNQNARFPRLSWVSSSSNYATSDFWLINGAYFRIKEITLGYTLPHKWTNAIHMDRLRLAATLTDFFTFSHFPDGWDPEVGVSAYPITKSVLFSVNVAF